MENKKLNFLVECEKCKNKVNAFSVVKHKEEFKLNEQSIFLTYYDCPKCGNRHFLQIDNDISKQLLVGITNTFTRLAVLKHKGKEIPKKQSEKFKRAREDLSEYRMILMKEFTGKTVVDATGIEYVLRFNI